MQLLLPFFTTLCPEPCSHIRQLLDPATVQELLQFGPDLSTHAPTEILDLYLLFSLSLDLDAAVPILPLQEGVHHLSVRVDFLLSFLIGELY